MARDNSPRERQRKHLERRLGRRESYDRILIVTEGSKTEPNYFGEIRNAFRLHTANVGIYPGAFGTDPVNVVKYARELFVEGDHQKRMPPRAFDQVYAVFDRDDHANYHEALTLSPCPRRCIRPPKGLAVEGSFSFLQSAPARMWRPTTRELNSPVRRSCAPRAWTGRYCGLR